jgi:hypothetical protein
MASRHVNNELVSHMLSNQAMFDLASLTAALLNFNALVVHNCAGVSRMECRTAGAFATAM